MKKAAERMPDFFVALADYFPEAIWPGFSW
jgi:hypothetical protein